LAFALNVLCISTPQRTFQPIVNISIAFDSFWDILFLPGFNTGYNAMHR